MPEATGALQWALFLSQEALGSPPGGLWAGTGPPGTNLPEATTARLPIGPGALQGPMPCLPSPSLSASQPTGLDSRQPV